jgi:hypothetical protein
MADTTTTTTMTDTTSSLASYGGFVDAIGGIATIVLAILGLAGVQSDMMVSILTIIFGVALLIHGGAMLSEYVYLAFPSGMTVASTPGTMIASPELSGVGTLSVLFLVGAAGIVLGILGLVGIYPGTLTSVAVIAFGAALVLSCNAVWNLQSLKPSMPIGGWRSGSVMLAGEMASGSAGIQALAGLTAVVLGILAVIGMRPEVLTFVALLVLGTTLVLTGTAMSAAVLSFMRPSARSMTRTSTYGGV